MSDRGMSDGIGVREQGRLTGWLADFSRRESRRLAGVGAQLAITTARSLPVRRLLIASGLAGEGKTVASVCLAVAMAAPRRPVVLVDGNAANPELHGLFGVSRRPGLVEMVRDGVPLQDCVRVTANPGLFILPIGGTPDDWVATLESPDLARVLERSTPQKGMMIIDGPSLLTHSEALVLVAHVDGVAQVVRCETTSQDVPLDVRDRVEAIGTPYLGVILNARRYYLPGFLYRRL